MDWIIALWMGFNFGFLVGAMYTGYIVEHDCFENNLENK